ncbi:MAG TPA: sigma-54-dependent Fis family transcriptional regulator [Candidatus Binatia bacterium]|nr:sigma-54-dependent Fis family transcriptional regulator [Candidatus Binatia bacterium]
MSDEMARAELLRVRRERDLYLRLLKLDEQTELNPFLDEALRVIVEVTGAAHGLLELYDDVEGAEGRRWSTAHRFSEQQVESVRLAISKGIIAQALTSGSTIVTASAQIDPRFRERESVQSGKIDAVLCAPVGGFPPFGVLYLQGRVQPGPFSDDDRLAAENFARHVAPLADRLLVRHRQLRESDATRALRAELRLEGIIGRSRALAQVLKQIALVAPLHVTVLLTGANGTGKSQLARAIHDNGPRCAGPFIALNCATLPEALVESELFGAVPGAHSTATRRVDGKIAAADGGTLLLDEIGELPLGAQAKLLQLLQSKTYFPLGSNKPVVADVRVIAATNSDLEAAVAARRFREDLFYRLQVVPIRVPSLAEHREDIPELIDHFCACAVERHQLPALTFSPGARRACQAAEWPGNVRQLEHAVEAAVIRAAGEGAVQVERGHVFPDGPGRAADSPRAQTLQEATRQFQARLVREVIVECGWNMVEAARRLDIARSHLYTLIRAFGIERERR